MKELANPLYPVPLILSLLWLNSGARVVIGEMFSLNFAQYDLPIGDHIINALPARTSPSSRPHPPNNLARAKRWGWQAIDGFKSISPGKGLLKNCGGLPGGHPDGHRRI